MLSLSPVEITLLGLLFFIWPAWAWIAWRLVASKDTDRKQEIEDQRCIEAQNELCGWLSLKSHL